MVTRWPGKVPIVYISPRKRRIAPLISRIPRAAYRFHLLVATIQPACQQILQGIFAGHPDNPFTSNRARMICVYYDLVQDPTQAHCLGDGCPMTLSHVHSICVNQHLLIDLIMSRPAIEFARFKTNDAFASQPSLFQQLLAGAQEGGIKSQSYGTSMKKPNEAVWLMYYDKLSDRASYKWPEARGEFFPQLLSICDGNPKMPWVIEVDALPEAALHAPVTELAHFTFKASVPVEEIRSVMESVYAMQKTASGIRPGVWGFHTDNDHRVSFVMGWDAFEAYAAATKMDPAKELRQKLRDLVEDVDVYHVELQHFPNEARSFNLNPIVAKRGQKSSRYDAAPPTNTPMGILTLSDKRNHCHGVEMTSLFISCHNYLRGPEGKNSIGGLGQTEVQEGGNQSWRAWAGQKIRLRRGIRDGMANLEETLNLFPGWAVRRCRKAGSGEHEGAFEVEVFVSGFAVAHGSANASRSQRAFMRLARSFASLPKITADALEPQPYAEPPIFLTPSTEELLAQKKLPPRPSEISEDYDVNTLERVFQHAQEQRDRSPGSSRSSSVSSGEHTSEYPNAESIDRNPVTAVPADVLRKLHANLESRLQPFWSSVLASRTVRLLLFASPHQYTTHRRDSQTDQDAVDYGPVAEQYVVTAADGSFHARFVVRWEDLCQHPGALHIAFGDQCEEHDLLVAAKLLPAQPSPASSYSNLEPPAEWESPVSPAKTIHIPITHSPIRVISDIDDTVKLSNVISGARAIFQSVFVKELQESIIPGMGEWYTSMWSTGVRFHYVSNGPFALLPVLNEFFQISQLPPGSMKLKSYSGRSIFNGLLSAPAARKRAGVVEILDAFPESRFLLIGDTGEQDLELYAELARERPNQILAVLVRDVEAGDPIDDPTGWKAVGAVSSLVGLQGGADETPRPRRMLSGLLSGKSTPTNPVSSRDDTTGGDYFTSYPLSAEPEQMPSAHTTPTNTTPTSAPAASALQTANGDMSKVPPESRSRPVHQSSVSSVTSRSPAASVTSLLSRLPEAEKRRYALQMRRPGGLLFVFIDSESLSVFPGIPACCPSASYPREMSVGYVDPVLFKSVSKSRTRIFRAVPRCARGIQTGADTTKLHGESKQDGPFAVKLDDDSFRSYRCDPPSLDAQVTKEELLCMYKQMQTMRRMEMAAESLYRAGLIRGFCHLSTGQEGVSVGIEHAIKPKDQVVTGYRCHPFVVLRGGTITQVLAELLGRRDGISKGKGGSMHMFTETFRGGHGIVGAQVPVGTGIAFTQKYTGDSHATFTLYGDGASNQGQVAESFNMAKLWDLPVVFICENNKYGMGTSAERSSANSLYYTRGDLIPGIQASTAVFGSHSVVLPTYQANGMDIIATRQAVQYARKWAAEDQKGPIILELVTYRYAGHSMSDPGTTYRTREEVRQMRSTRDPIRGLQRYIEDWGLASEKELRCIDKEAKAVVDKAVEEAKASPEPDPEELWTDIYAADAGTPKRRGRERGEVHYY
ncbi:putative the pyruvate dehydrogenase complex catalyzes the overall conversion of pyruvate to acetyl-CoA and CO(2) [Lyophyllum shimeji]|uniref:Pyruvate dehydrogenase E1 component subunit alpha, mitochondrial n=1 Tax=Lyophyllum shimeji TaxID=47721 RepID=A0A9P3PXC5_LYOSH|nr:putative the pyruvate dehydrogenase complex catalyzes the overall conversion of pyruvate to acetyl-CoA and CO(2) [Lyophyllum shimeji]